ncbi:transcriptional regulator with XRE-family HTH domain [Breznakia sp. PF5-3]|uniref:helix-turn-helix domain-containing protein n=1 Tax=unclassified Breznakia TaxID=2623764 RepID=UPI0024049FC7|nr:MULTISPECIES: helix-turn-helix transcriptional regulator [unclassified Breznakia]MDL2276296.1 helix-turn-helix domain-containing protein [Breznakia sp. OttesenSCG-928-G09]MDF9825125.1 transcriptional regulator with XRE-family HTH domain [Breznakia sp. PM6-1]MDF9836016.1 transcriptional regulator with XRE-family HTH domain [Breznakia sp. PF5-3]MDF9838114.1 transcriptional regulator with XRE-family HTH domain [Breznakia sp. PFB2-8]MDF9860056.1 transcriptional regulator with XRE-family HTH dom
MDIAKKLQRYREDKSLTQEQVAENIHCSRQTISNWETGKSLPDITSIVLLSTLYEVSLDEMLKGDSIMLHHMQEELKKLEISNYTKKTNKRFVNFQKNFTKGWKIDWISIVGYTLFMLVLYTAIILFFINR